jgi:hypothetical protein
MIYDTSSVHSVASTFGDEGESWLVLSVSPVSINTGIRDMNGKGNTYQLESPRDAF